MTPEQQYADLDRRFRQLEQQWDKLIGEVARLQQMVDQLQAVVESIYGRRA